MCLAVPGKIIEIYEKQGLTMAKVDFSGVTREACIEHVPEAQIGDYAIIHVGFAISLLSEEEAQKSIDLLREILEAGEKPEDENIT
ncbi:MAG: HypC/HybG/HupF family hydrogenase formation chaperone [Anaerolineales bacterium]|nr:HypC/HybG/HupF family hydrogenase formation chaperone [Anaerolineales bacterium]